MFTFEPYDECEIKGRSRDKVDDDLKKVFCYTIYCEEKNKLKGRIFVKLNKDYIQFFIDNKENMAIPRMLESISLTNPKDTGYDLLFFAEEIQKGTIYDGTVSGNEGAGSAKQHSQFIQRAANIFNGFPFLERENQTQNPDQTLLRICLLEFLLAIDTHDDIFAINPDFDELRGRLRASKVYLLLCAKLRYCMYCYDGRKALNAEEYTFVVTKFSDLLMDKNYNKMVPLSYYDEPRFLYNPEKELCRIMRGRDSRVLPKEATREKITGFFQTKHATIESGYGRWQRGLRIVRNLLMLIMVLWTILSLMWFDFGEKGQVTLVFFLRRWNLTINIEDYALLRQLTHWTNMFYDSNLFLCGLVLWMVLSLLIMVIPIVGRSKGSGFQMAGGRVFHSRIVVALLMGWFTIAISEDLIKSQLELSRTMVWWALVAIIGIVGMMLWGEVRQHSPYYCRIKLRWPPRITSWPKVSVVLVYALFWDFLFGIVMQGITYSPLLETSGALPTAILGRMPDEANRYRKTVEMCIGMLDDYGRTMDGIIHDHGKMTSVNTPATIEQNVSDSTMTLVVNMFETKMHQSNDLKYVKQTIEVHNSYLDKMQEWLQQYEKNDRVRFRYDSIQRKMCVMERRNKDSIYYLITEQNDGLSISRDGDTNRGIFVVRDSSSMSDCINDSLYLPDPIFDQFAKWLDDDNVRIPNGTKEQKMKTIIVNNMITARDLKMEMRNQLLLIEDFIQEECNPAKLKEYTQFVNDNDTIKARASRFNTKNYYLAYLGYDASVNHKFCRRFNIINLKGRQEGNVTESMPIIDISPILFPRMLVFHSLIVLIIAFVGQLIVSDKSVTEPL